MNEFEETEPPGYTPEQLSEPTTPVPEPVTKQTSVARSAGIVSIAVMFSRVLGLVREQVFAYYFGAGFLYDAYVVAFRIPNVLRDLFAEARSVGRVRQGFYRLSDKQERKRSVASGRPCDQCAGRRDEHYLHCGNIVFPAIRRSGRRRFFAGKGSGCATTLTQIMFPFILLVALAAVAMGVLNTKGVFGIPASASTVFNIVSIIVGLGLAFWLSGGGWLGGGDRNALPSDAGPVGNNRHGDRHADRRSVSIPDAVAGTLGRWLSVRTSTELYR